MSMFVLFSGLFGHFESLALFSKMEDKPCTKAVKQDVFSQFFKDTKISNSIHGNSLKKLRLF